MLTLSFSYRYRALRTVCELLAVCPYAKVDGLNEQPPELVGIKGAPFALMARVAGMLSVAIGCCVRMKRSPDHVSQHFAPVFICAQREISTPSQLLKYRHCLDRRGPSLFNRFEYCCLKP